MLQMHALASSDCAVASDVLGFVCAYALWAFDFFTLLGLGVLASRNAALGSQLKTWTLLPPPRALNSVGAATIGTRNGLQIQLVVQRSAFTENACVGTLVAPYCAIPRDYLSDTPLLRAMGFCGVSTWPIGCDTPSPFSESFPCGGHAKWRCDTPPQKGYLSDTGAIPYENKANGCDTPLCDTISKGYCAIGGGGISHRAAKVGAFFSVTW